MSIFCSVVVMLVCRYVFNGFTSKSVSYFLSNTHLLTARFSKENKNRQHCLTSVRGVELVVSTGDVMWNIVAVSANVSAELYCEGAQDICHTFPYATRHNDGLGNTVANIHTMWFP